MANKIQMPSKEEMQASWDAIRDETTTLKPVGWRILVMMPEIKETTSGGIYLPDDYTAKEQVASPIGFVCDKGPLCYLDPKKFSDGQHWCQRGDIIFFRAYAGTRVVIKGREFRFITDESVEGVVGDPRGIERI